jgi:6-phosphofructokinase 1
MKRNAIIVHGGAPTAVLNASLYGALKELKRDSGIDKIYGAAGGMRGILRRRFIELNRLTQAEIEKLPNSPGSAIGTSRDHLEDEDYRAIAGILGSENIRHVLVTGGNGSMDTAGKIERAAGSREFFIIGIPKTMDNDIAVTDHTPGFGSAARYIAAITREVALDVESLPIHVSVIETMGRNAGWITASSALSGKGPDIICLPEVPFDETRFLDTVQSLWRKKGGLVVAAGEGLKNASGPIVEPAFSTGRSVYYGDVGASLASLIIKRLNIKARSEKPGIIGRASVLYRSETDVQEAVLAGEEAARASLGGKTGFMIGFERQPGPEYHCNTILIPFDEAMLHEKVLPSEFIDLDKMAVTQKFTGWCRPLIGPPLPDFAGPGDLQCYEVEK